MQEWNQSSYQEIIRFLEEEQEEDYRTFQQKLIKTNDKIWGVRVDKLRKKAVAIAKRDIISFLEIKDKNSFEEVLLEGFVLGKIKDTSLFWKYFKEYIKKVDNWASCDMACSSFKLLKEKEKRKVLKPKITKLLQSKKEFTVRIGVVLLMDYYMEDLDEVLALVDNIDLDYYYVKMAIAWLISVALVKDYATTFQYLQNDHLDLFTHNKALQKARESFRLTKEQKEELLKLKKCHFT